MLAEDFAKELGITNAKLKQLGAKLFNESPKHIYTEEEQAVIRQALQMAVSSLENTGSKITSVKQLEASLEETYTAKDLRTVSNVAKAVGLPYLQKQYASLLIEQAKSFSSVLGVVDKLNFQLEQSIYQKTGGTLERITNNIKFATDSVVELVNKHESDLFTEEFLNDLESLL